MKGGGEAVKVMLIGLVCSVGFWSGCTVRQGVVCRVRRRVVGAVLVNGECFGGCSAGVGGCEDSRGGEIRIGFGLHISYSGSFFYCGLLQRPGPAWAGAG